MSSETDRSSEALHSAFAQHYAPLRLATLLLAGRQEAEDLAQEVFVRAAKAIPGLDEATVGPYLRQTLLNVIRNRFRHLKVERRHARDQGTPASRARFLEVMGKSDPLIADALQTLLDRGDFIPSVPDEGSGAAFLDRFAPAERAAIETDPAIVTELIARTQESLAAAESDIGTRQGTALIDFILEDIQELKRILFDPGSFHVFMTAMDAASWLNEHLEDWLGGEEHGRRVHAVRPSQHHFGDGGRFWTSRT